MRVLCSITQSQTSQTRTTNTCLIACLLAHTHVCTPPCPDPAPGASASIHTPPCVSLIPLYCTVLPAGWGSSCCGKMFSSFIATSSAQYSVMRNEVKTLPEYSNDLLSYKAYMHVENCIRTALRWLNLDRTMFFSSARERQVHACRYGPPRIPRKHHGDR
jgi:hypothetical protein